METEGKVLAIYKPKSKALDEDNIYFLTILKYGLGFSQNLACSMKIGETEKFLQGMNNKPLPGKTPAPKQREETLHQIVQQFQPAYK